MDFDDLYREIILDHYRSPRNRGELAPPAHRVEGFNPLCGDEVTVYLDVNDGVLTDINGPVRAILVQPDGRIIIGGLFTSVKGANATSNYNYIARLNSDGSTDTGRNVAELNASESRRRVEMPATSSTAFRNKSSLAFDGLVKPLIFLTN